MGRRGSSTLAARIGGLLTTQNAVLFLIISAAIFVMPIYTGYPFSITGLNPKGNAMSIVLESFYNTSCSVRFISPDGENVSSYTPCKFTYQAGAESTSIRVKSAKYGVLDSRLTSQLRWDGMRCTTSNWYDYRAIGRAVSDYGNDDIAWNLIADFQDAVNGPINNHTTAGGGIYIVSDGSMWQHATYYATGRHGPCSTCNGQCDSCQCFNSITTGTRLREVNNRFQVTVSASDGQSHSCYGGCSPPTFIGPYSITFEVLNPSFYTDEMAARNTINPPEYRPADCPLLPGYTLDQEMFYAGENVSLQGFNYTVELLCASQPTAILDSTGKRIMSDESKLKMLMQGGSYIVPAGQIHQIPYVRVDINGCETDNQCNPPALCNGIFGQCVNHQCQYQGECLTPPKPESIFDRLLLAFSSWINYIRSLIGW